MLNTTTYTPIGTATTTFFAKFPIAENAPFFGTDAIRVEAAVNVAKAIMTGKLEETKAALNSYSCKTTKEQKAKHENPAVFNDNKVRNLFSRILHDDASAVAELRKVDGIIRLAHFGDPFIENPDVEYPAYLAEQVTTGVSLFTCNYFTYKKKTYRHIREAFETETNSNLDKIFSTRSAREVAYDYIKGMINFHIEDMDTVEIEPKLKKVIMMEDAERNISRKLPCQNAINRMAKFIKDNSVEFADWLDKQSIYKELYKAPDLSNEEVVFTPSIDELEAEAQAQLDCCNKDYIPEKESTVESRIAAYWRAVRCFRHYSDAMKTAETICKFFKVEFNSEYFLDWLKAYKPAYYQQVEESFELSNIWLHTPKAFRTANMVYNLLSTNTAADNATAERAATVRQLDSCKEDGSFGEFAKVLEKTMEVVSYGKPRYYEKAFNAIVSEDKYASVGEFVDASRMANKEIHLNVAKPILEGKDAEQFIADKLDQLAGDIDDKKYVRFVLAGYPGYIVEKILADIDDLGHDDLFPWDILVDYEPYNENGNPIHGTLGRQLCEAAHKIVVTGESTYDDYCDSIIGAQYDDEIAMELAQDALKQENLHRQAWNDSLTDSEKFCETFSDLVERIRLYDATFEEIGTKTNEVINDDLGF